ncbi:hypothetical protein DSCO28_68270 [Desulfosarcina ovata subsp. sediminis]|uniref:Cyclic nucleotide-binding protein n=1 Tax=Desulfosarcina ovata subsp. sediminis TaxID=885957 RepID=A0A5K8A1G4_9BACT|nr:HDOD domain-containing protein [Desulfosarcina ovata]BBO86261.1 hypothetical protein DSCO28_68270 [Desulfosarcina ovata subsp. sediminis]
MGSSLVEKLSIINRLGFFNSFTADEKRQVASEDSHFQVYDPGTVVIRKGSSDQSLLIILSGSVAVAEGTGDAVLAILKAGEVLGEMAFLTETRRTAQVIAREPVIALKLDRLMFEKFPAPIREKFKDQIIMKLVTRLDMANRELTRYRGTGNGGSPAETPGPFRVPAAGATESELATGRDLIRKIVSNTTSLPAMPAVMLKVQQMLRSPATSPAQLAKVIETDAAMVTDILKLANSAFFGFRGKVSTVQHASSLLGTRRLAELITAISAGSVLGSAMRGYNLKSGDMWRHSIAVAVTASEIAGAMSSEAVETAYMAGLLHDVGKIILDPYVRERKVLFDHYLETHPGKCIQDAERDLLGFDHAVIASILCDNWSLPRAISFAIRHHHQPASAGDHQLAHIIHYADILVIQAGLAGSGGYAPPELDPRSRSMVSLDPDTLQHSVEKALQYMDGLKGRLFAP